MGSLVRSNLKRSFFSLRSHSVLVENLKISRLGYWIAGGGPKKDRKKAIADVEGGGDMEANISTSPL